MSRAYTDVSNDNSTILKQLEEERYQTRQLQAQLNELCSMYDDRSRQLLEVATRNGLLSDANINLTKELEKESGDSRDLQAQLSCANINLTKELEKESGASRHLQEQLKELRSRYDDRSRQLLDVATRNGLLSDANLHLTKELEKESGASRDLQAQMKKQCSLYEDHQTQQKRVECVMANRVNILKERIQQLERTSSMMSSDMSSGLNTSASSGQLQSSHVSSLPPTVSMRSLGSSITMITQPLDASRAPVMSPGHVHDVTSPPASPIMLSVMPAQTPPSPPVLSSAESSPCTPTASPAEFAPSLPHPAPSFEMPHSTTSQRSPVHSPVSSTSGILNEISISSPTPSHPLDVESRSSPVVDLTSNRETSSTSSPVLSLAKPSTHTPAASPAKQPRFSPSSSSETPLLATSQRICVSSHAPRHQ